PYKAIQAFLFSKLNDQTTPQSCNFQTVRDNPKQSDWLLPGKIAPHLHSIQLFSVASPKTVVYVTMDWLPLKCMGFRISRCSLRCHGFVLYATTVWGVTWFRF